jgi:Tfp pilus assembly protein PilV
MRRPRGFSLAEALVAAVILGFALLVGLGVVIWCDRVERRATLRMQATELAASLAERVRAAPYGEVTSGELDMSHEMIPDLPNPTVSLDVREDEDLHLRTVGVIVSWQGEEPGTVRIDTAVGSAQVYSR